MEEGTAVRTLLQNDMDKDKMCFIVVMESLNEMEHYQTLERAYLKRD